MGKYNANYPGTLLYFHAGLYRQPTTDNRQPTTDVELGPVMLRDNFNDLYYLKEGQARRLRVIICIIPAANSTPLPLHS